MVPLSVVGGELVLSIIQRPDTFNFLYTKSKNYFLPAFCFAFFIIVLPSVTVPCAAFVCVTACPVRRVKRYGVRVESVVFNNGYKGLQCVCPQTNQTILR